MDYLLLQISLQYQQRYCIWILLEYSENGHYVFGLSICVFGSLLAWQLKEANIRCCAPIAQGGTDVGFNFLQGQHALSLFDV